MDLAEPRYSRTTHRNFTAISHRKVEYGRQLIDDVIQVPDSQNIRHSFEIRFTFPVTLAEKISDACCTTAGGMTAVREADGIWRNCNGTKVKDEMRLGIVTVKDEIKIDYLRQRIGWILAEYGEECMWFVYHRINGGIFDL